MRRTSMVGVLVALALVAAACGGGSDDESSADTDVEPTTEVAAQPTDAPAEAEVPTETPEEPEPTPEPPTPEPVPDVPLADLIPAFDTLGARPAVEVDGARPDPMCPGFDQFNGLTVEDLAMRAFRADPQLGPFTSVGILQFSDGDADAFLDAYLEGAAGPCAQYETTGAAGAPLNLAWSEVTGPELGDRTVSLAVRGDSSGFPVNSEVVLVRMGERVGYVGYLVFGRVPDEATRDAAAAAIASSLGGENVGTIDLDSSAADILAALPGLDELANPELTSEAFSAAIPDGQCPSNTTTLAGLTLEGAAARAFLMDQDFGPFVTVSILEFAPGEADEFIDRWVAGANGPCSTTYNTSGFDFAWSVGSGAEYLDRTVTLFGRGFHPVVASPVSADYVLVRSGDFVGYIHYFLFEDAPTVATRDTMVDALVAALGQVSP